MMPRAIALPAAVAIVPVRVRIRIQATVASAVGGRRGELGVERDLHLVEVGVLLHVVALKLLREERVQVPVQDLAVPPELRDDVVRRQRRHVPREQLARAVPVDLHQLPNAVAALGPEVVLADEHEDVLGHGLVAQVGNDDVEGIVAAAVALGLPLLLPEQAQVVTRIEDAVQSVFPAAELVVELGLRPVQGRVSLAAHLRHRVDLLVQLLEEGLRVEGKPQQP
mmetsp:Transcript_24657/g.77307  ORF Transcript_24657/g.77307 Transcript_24657/m.77307 type:complete len:224 (-) Transcript_24657:708-1379(-)